jgi:hypothetical protein
MSQRIYFSGVGEPDLWNLRFLTNVSERMLGFMTWDAGPGLAQATWEWPSRPRVESAYARVADKEIRAANLDWERRGIKEFARRLYHDDPLWREIQEAKGTR